MLELKIDAASGEISGYASAFGGPPDSYGDIVRPGAFAKSLASHRAGGTKPLMLWAHDPSEVPIGTWSEFREDDFGLYVAGKLNLEIARGREVHSALQAKSLAGLSIGFRTPPGGRVAAKGFYELREVELQEISVVSFPAAKRARISATKSTSQDEQLKAALAEIKAMHR